MLSDFLQMLMGNGGQPAAPTGAPTPAPIVPTSMPGAQPQPGQYGPPAPGQYGPQMPAYMQNLSAAPGANPSQGLDSRQQAIMKMLQQGMMGQGQQQQQQAPQVPPMALGSGKAGMGQMPQGSLVANLMQRNVPTTFPRPRLGMGY